MIQSSIIPRATARHQLTGFGLSQQLTEPKSLHEAVSRPGLYEEEEEELAPYSTTLSSSLGLSLPNPAPTVELQANDDGKKSSVITVGLSNCFSSNCENMEFLFRNYDVAQLQRGEKASRRNCGH